MAFGKRVNSDASSVKSKEAPGARKPAAAAKGRVSAASVSIIGEQLKAVPEEDGTFEGTDREIGSKLTEDPFAEHGENFNKLGRRGDWEESKRPVRDIFQDSVGDNFFPEPSSSTVQNVGSTTRQPKVDFNLDADEAEHSHYRLSSSGRGSEKNRLSSASNNTQTKSILRQTGQLIIEDNACEAEVQQKRRNVKFELEPSPFKVAPNLTDKIDDPGASYRNPWDLLGRDQHDLPLHPFGMEPLNGPSDEETLN